MKENLTPERLAQVLSHRGIHGVIIGPLESAEKSIDLVWQDIAAVTIGYSLAAPALHRVATDFGAAIDGLLKQLELRGYRRPGLAGTRNSFARTRMQAVYRLLGWQRYQASEPPVPPLLQSTADRSEFMAWIAQHRPDVVISNLPAVASWLRDGGFRVPEDIGWCNPTMYSTDEEPAAGMLELQEAVGGGAVDLLLPLLYHNELGLPSHPKLTLIEAQWCDGPTLRPLRAE